MKFQSAKIILKQNFKKAFAPAVFVLAGLACAVLVGATEHSNSGLLSLAGIVNVPVARAESQPVVFSYGYYNPAPQGYMYVQSAVYNSFFRKWNFQISYVVQNVKDGSLTLGQQVLANHINHSGFVGVLLNPRTTYTFRLYQNSNGRGPVLNVFTFTTLPAPSYGYGHY